MKKTIAVVIFLGCMLGQSVSYAEGVGAKECNYEHHQKKAKRAKADRLKAKLEQWTKVLNLTAEQQAGTKEILSKSQEDMKVIWQDAHAKTKGIRVAAHDQIAGLLSDEQKVKFKDLRKKCEESPEARIADKE